MSFNSLAGDATPVDVTHADVTPPLTLVEADL